MRCPESLESEPPEALIQLADDCQQASDAKYCEVLSQQFACPPHNIPDPIRYLARLPFKSYVTTTFDPLIHRALEDEPNKCAGIYSFPSLPAKFEKGNLFHIHGKIDDGAALDPSNVILSKTSFDQAYDPENSPLWSFLQQLWINEPCCFVGCGLKEPEFQKLLGVCARLRDNAMRARGTGDPPERFALFPESSPESVPSFEPNQLERQREEEALQGAQLSENLKRVGITVVRYRVSGSEHVALKQFLRECINNTPIEFRKFPE